MPDRILVTTDDLEHAVRINAGLEGAGFDSELNAASIISRDSVETFPLGPKSALAALILDRAETRLAPLTT